MNPLYRLFGYARPYRGRLATAIVAMVFYAAASAGVAWLIKPLFDGVLPTGDGFAAWSTAVLIVYGVKGAGAYASTFLMTDIGQRVVRDVRDRLFRHILDQSASFFSRKTTGQLMSRITNDVNQIQQVVSETVGDLMREGFSLVGFAAYLFYRDWKLALVAVTGAPVVLYPLVRLASASGARREGARRNWSTCRTSRPRHSRATGSSRHSARRPTRRADFAAHRSGFTEPTSR